VGVGQADGREKQKPDCGESEKSRQKSMRKIIDYSFMDLDY
jgi:hypothetical protein